LFVRTSAPPAAFVPGIPPPIQSVRFWYFLEVLFASGSFSAPPMPHFLLFNESDSLLFSSLFCRSAFGVVKTIQISVGELFPLTCCPGLCPPPSPPSTTRSLKEVGEYCVVPFVRLPLHSTLVAIDALFGSFPQDSSSALSTEFYSDCSAPLCSPGCPSRHVWSAFFHFGFKFPSCQFLGLGNPIFSNYPRSWFCGIVEKAFSPFLVVPPSSLE